MLISERMARELSEELVNEYWAAIQYTMVSAYFSREALPQLANLFRQQSSEELMHAQKIVDYVTVGRWHRRWCPPSRQVQADFESVEEAVEERCEHATAFPARTWVWLVVSGPGAAAVQSASSAHAPTRVEG